MVTLGIVSSIYGHFGDETHVRKSLNLAQVQFCESKK